MERSNLADGCFIAVVIIGLLFLVLGGAGILATDLLDSYDAQAERDRAAADLLRAQADLEEQRTENWERRWMLWTATLAAFRDDALLIILVVALALLSGFLLADIARDRAQRL